MSISLAAIGSALASVAGAGGNIAGQTGWLNYSSAKSLNKKTAEQNAAISLDTARQLALNQHSWNVQGLRNAGLNPILAATNLGNTSLPSVNGSIGSSSGMSFDNPVSTALQVSNMQKQNDNLEKQNDLLSAQKSQVEADIIKILSDANVNSARVSNINQDTLNKANTRGLTGPYAAANQVGQDSVKVVPWLFNKIKSGFQEGNRLSDKYFNIPISSSVKKIKASFSNSAKDYSSGIKKLSPSKSSPQHIKDEYLYRH